MISVAFLVMGLALSLTTGLRTPARVRVTFRVGHPPTKRPA